MNPEIVYAPGHGNDISHCEAFSRARRIVNLDINSESVELLRRIYNSENNIENHLGVAEKFDLHDTADLVLLLAPA